MSRAPAISLRRVAALDLARKLSRWVNIAALVACAAVVLYVAGNFAAELLSPRAPLSTAPGLFGADDGRRAVGLINPTLRWLGMILFVPGNLQMSVGALLTWHGKPGVKRMVAGCSLLALSFLFYLAGTLSCACAVPLD